MFPSLSIDEYKPCKKLSNAISNYVDGANISADSLVTLRAHSGVTSVFERFVFVCSSAQLEDNSCLRVSVFLDFRELGSNTLRFLVVWTLNVLKHSVFAISTVFEPSC